jgi:hypothetical protein
VIYTTEMPSRGIISLSSFMKIGTCVKAIIRFSVNNLNGCNVDITEGKKL